MTESDEFLGATLRQAMADVAGSVQPSPDGLARIRDRIGGRPSRPPLVAALACAAERVRYWTWLGHWAVPGATPRDPRPGAPGRGRRRAPARRGPQWGLTGLRLVAVLGGITVVVGVSFAVQPFRSAIIQASSTMLNGGSSGQDHGSGTDGNGAQGPGGGGQAPGGGSPTDARGRHASPGASGQAAPDAVNPDATASCAPATGSTPTGTGSATASAAAVNPDAVNPDAVNPDTAAGCAPATVAPGSPAPTGGATSTVPVWYPTGGGWYYTVPASSSAASPAAPGPTPTYSNPHHWWPTQPPATPTPTGSPAPVPTPTPTPTPTDSGGDSSSPDPSGS